MSVLRRTFLISGGALVLAGAGSVLACRNRSEALAQLDRLDVLLPTIRQAQAVGAQVRAIAEPDALLDAALMRPHIAQALALDCPASRSAVMARGIRHEFAAGRVQVAARFVLSDTECLVAGLRA